MLSSLGFVLPRLRGRSVRLLLLHSPGGGWAFPCREGSTPPAYGDLPASGEVHNQHLQWVHYHLPHALAGGGGSQRAIIGQRRHTTHYSSLSELERGRLICFLHCRARWIFTHQLKTQSRLLSAQLSRQRYRRVANNLTKNDNTNQLYITVLHQ